MLMRMLAGGLIAGFAAGLFAAMLHFAFVQELILQAELYETGDLVHFGEPMDHGAQDAHGGHGGHGEAGAASAFTRNALTVLFSGLIYAAYGLILVAGYQVAALFGRALTPAEGVLWGIAGFAAFQLSPAMGLAPELPGTIAADLSLRQIWWLGCVAATIGGLALIGYGRGMIATIAGAVLVVLPHAIGAPVLDEYYGYAPPELAAEFSARVLGVGLAVWALLGWLTAKLAAPEPEA